MSMWPQFTPQQQNAVDIAHKVLGNRNPTNWLEVEAMVREAFVEAAKQRGVSDFTVTHATVDMLFEHEVHLIWPVIRRFFSAKVGKC